MAARALRTRAALGILDVRFDWMRQPTSERVLKRLVLESVDWVNVVALTKDGLSIMVDQYRFGIGERTLETPCGVVDVGETPLAAAQRELLEETGYGGGKWRSLAPQRTPPAGRTEDPPPPHASKNAVDKERQAPAASRLATGFLRHGVRVRGYVTDSTPSSASPLLTVAGTLMLPKDRMLARRTALG